MLLCAKIYLIGYKNYENKIFSMQDLEERLLAAKDKKQYHH